MIYDASQSIVYHSKRVNAYFSTLFTVLAERLLTILKPNFRIFFRMDRVSFERTLDKMLLGNDYKVYEFDFSKYDKSQDVYCHQMEMYLFGRLGMRYDDMVTWSSGHIICQCKAWGQGISVMNRYQRKSGDATTFLGNTVLNMVALGYGHDRYDGNDFDDIIYAVFAGDDSLLFYAADKLVDTIRVVNRMSDTFNLECKLRSNSVPYFCSSFVVNHLGSWYFITDPVKRIEKLGQPYLRDENLLREIWVSFRDLCTHYRNILLAKLLSIFVYVRYRVFADLHFIFGVITAMINDFECFKSLYV